MTNATPAAGTPAADPYLRWETVGGWSAQPDQRTLERERLESRAKGTDATLQLLRCFPSWTRALEQLTFRTLERLAANEPVDPNDSDGWRNRDAHAQAVLHRHGKGKLSATRLTSAAITALIDGQAAADRDAGLDWSTVTTPASTLDERAGARPRHAARRPRRSSGLGVSARSAARARPAARARRPSSGRPVAVAARQPEPVRRRRPALLADRLGHLVVARRRAARQRGHGRAAGRRVRRAGDGIERRVAADAGARARHDPAGRGARRPARARSALGGAADRQPRGAARADQRAHACMPGRGSAWTPRGSSRRSSRASSGRRSARACRATSATGGAGSPSIDAPTRAPTARARPSSSSGCSRSPHVGSPSGGSARRRARSSTRARAR